MSGIRGRVERKVKDYVGVSDDDPETVTVSSWINARVHALGPIVCPFPAWTTLRTQLTLWQGRDYLKSLFPFIQWVPRYNFTWLYGDLVA